MSSRKTKVIEYRGDEYTVPEWVNWVAQDYFGTIYGYDIEPVIIADHDCWDIASDGDLHCMVRAGWNCPRVQCWKTTKVLLGAENE